MVEIIWEAEVVQGVMVLVVIAILTNMVLGTDDKADLCKIKLKQHSLYHLLNAEL